VSRSTHARSVAESIRNNWEGGCQSSLPKGPKIELPQNGVFGNLIHGFVYGDQRLFSTKRFYRFDGRFSTCRNQAGGYA
jgi:hypothetical protein